jgi:hypothetical protein
MNVYHIQRRAFLIALVTMAGMLTVLLWYWKGVSRGALPSPVQPIVAQKTAPVTAKARVAIHESMPMHNAEAGLAAEAGLGGATSSVLAAQSAYADADANRSAQTVIESKQAGLKISVPEPFKNKPDESKPALASAPKADPENSTPKSSAPAAETSTSHVSPTASDERLARHWLSNTNDRPVIRLQYAPGDIVRLAQAGRGLLLATSSPTAPPRQLYLQPIDGTTPLFVPYTPRVADRFSTYSLSMEPSAELDAITAALPAYFPNGEFSLEYVFDRDLATEIFTQIAAASRGLSDRDSHRALIEGELVVEGTRPAFKLLQVHAEGQAN